MLLDHHHSEHHFDGHLLPKRKRAAVVAQLLLMEQILWHVQRITLDQRSGSILGLLHTQPRLEKALVPGVVRLSSTTTEVWALAVRSHPMNI